MTDFLLKANNVTKSYTSGIGLFAPVSFSLKNGEIIGVCGENGSGKSTLMKMIVGALEITKGNIELTLNNESIKSIDYKNHFGFVSPYLRLYDEFDAEEMIIVASKLRHIKIDKKYSKELLKRFDLYHRRLQAVKTFSSGMKQRLLYVIALLHNPEILLLDEPSSNLDIKGIDIVENMIKEHSQAGGAVIIATNESREAALCGEIINIA